MNKVFDLLDSILTSNRSETGYWLGILRIGAGLTLIAKIISEFAGAPMLYGHDGLVRMEVSAVMGHGTIPTLYSIWHMTGGCCTEGVFIEIFFVCHLIFAVLLVLGLMTRLSAFMCWAMQVILFNGSHFTSYGFDAILLSLLFYALVFPSGRFCSLDNMIKPGRDKPGPDMMSLWQGTIQVHLCIIYLVSGVTKVTMGQWADGRAMWDVVNQPQFVTIFLPLARRFFSLWYFSQISGVLVLLMEILYPALIWVRRLNVIFLAGILLLHILIALVLGLWLFSFAMIVFNLAGFGHLLIRKKGIYPVPGEGRI